MSIGDICNRDVVYVNRDVTVHAAARLMRHYHVGSLVVVDERDGKRVPAGMVTDRDLVIEIYAMDLDPKVLTVGDIMFPALVTAPESLGVPAALALMRAKGVRRMPLTDSDNQLSGIVTIDDVLVVLAEALTDISRTVAREPARDTPQRQ